MSLGRIRGVNAHGHLGWVTVKCRICGRKMDVTKQPVYKCPKCAETRQAYFCEADARILHYRCPYCKTPLVPYSEPTGKA